LMLATGSAKLNALVKRSPHATPPTSQSSPLPPGTPPHLLHPTPLLRARTRIKISPLKSPPQRTPPHPLQTSPMSFGRMGNSLLRSVQGASPTPSVFSAEMLAIMQRIALSPLHALQRLVLLRRQLRLLLRRSLLRRKNSPQLQYSCAAWRLR